MGRGQGSGRSNKGGGGGGGTPPAALELPGGRTVNLKAPYSVGEDLVVDKKVGDRLADNLKPGDELVYAWRDGTITRHKITSINETKTSWGKPTGEREFRVEKGVPLSEVDVNAWRMKDAKIFVVRDNQFRALKGFNVYAKKKR